MPTPTGKPPFTLLPITKFHSDSDRRLDGLRRAELERACFDIERQIPQLTTRQKINEEHRQRLISLIASRLEKRKTDYRILLFVPTKQEGLEVARRLKQLVPSNYLIDDFAVTSTVNQSPRTIDLRSALKVTERKDLVRELTELAEHGIFLHHSDLPPALRECVEKVCASSPTKGSQVIVATETLSYGVNLAVNDVVLSGVAFFSTDRRGFVKPIPLSSSAFHNMVGRAGRLGKSDHESASVYLVLPLPLPPESTSGPRAVIQKYYLKIPQERSVLYLDDDDTATKKQTTEHLKPQLFSAPFVRCILDALRHCNLQDIGRQERRPVHAAEVQDLIGRTLWFAEWTEKLKRNPPVAKAQVYLTNLLSATQYVLDGCVATPLNLVEKITIGEGQLPTYRISERGEAIIDTGTELSTIEPLLKFTYELQNAWTTFCPSPPGVMPSQPPAGLFILSLLAQEQIFGDVIRYTPECFKAPDHRTRWPGTRPKQNQEAVFEQFSTALAGIQIIEPRPLAIALRDQLKRWEPLAQEKANYDGGAVEGVLRLFNSTVAWISGASLDDVFQLIEQVDTPEYKRMRVTGEMQNHRNFVEQLGWKIAALTKIVFKVRVPEALPSELERDMLLLRERLKRGCKTEMIEFFHPRRSNLQRSEVRRLEQNGVTPAKMLAGGGTGAGAALEARKLELLREDLIERASDQFEDLAGAFAEVDVESVVRNKSNDLWRCLQDGSFRHAIAEFFGKPRVKTLVNSNPIDKLLRDNCTFGRADWQESPTSSADRTVFDVEGLPTGSDDLRFVATPGADSRGVIWQQQTRPITRLEEGSGPREHWFDAGKWSRVRIIGIQAREDWMFSIDGHSFRPLQAYITQFSNEEHLLFVCAPWVPSLDRMPLATRGALEVRISREQKTTIATPAAFATLFDAMARGSILSLDLNEFFLDHGSIENLFIGVNTLSMRRSLEKEGVLPAVLREKLLQHFEVSFEHGGNPVGMPPQS